MPTWRRVLESLAARRQRDAPTDAQVLARFRDGAGSVDDLLRARPKEMFDAALSVLNLRHSPEVFEHLGAHVSIARLKEGSFIQRLTITLSRWFPPA